MSSQRDAIRDGVHLEYVSLNCWRLTGQRTVYCKREERRMSKSKQKRLHLSDNLFIVWTVTQAAEEKDGAPFYTAAGALAHAFVEAGSIPLEI